MKNFILSLGLGAAAVSAHFNLEYPQARGFDEDKLDKFPCGGQNTVSATRTPWPLKDGKIALKMGHSESNVQVLLAMGNNPGSAFNTVIKPTFTEIGLGAFCIEGISVPASLGAREGMNATIQVITNGDPAGGLYNCADITFSASAVAPSASVCRNNTGVSTSKASNSLSPNVTSEPGATTSSGGKNNTSAASDMRAGVSLAGLLAVTGAMFLF